MEFHEKLQELRKQRGLTQEELARELYVSRTAISKWESGKGYPNIDSLKQISRFFSVTIDDLLSSEELISAARDENSSNLRGLTDLLLGITDVLHLLLMILPLYPEPAGDTVASVNLPVFTHRDLLLRILLWGLLAALILAGAAKILLNVRRIEKGRTPLTAFSLCVSILLVLLLTMTRAPYAVTVTFLLLIVKGILLFQTPRHNG